MIEEKLSLLGFSLPSPPSPAGSYVPAIQVGNLVFTSGQIPRWNGEWRSVSRGRLGVSLTKEQGYEACQLSVLNALAAIKQVIGSLDRIEQVIKVTVFVCSNFGFTEQPFVANGASELLKNLFDEKGEHARSAVGVAELPLGCSVEVEIIVAVK